MNPETFIALAAVVAGPGAALGLTKWILSGIKEDIREIKSDGKELRKEVFKVQIQVARLSDRK